MKKIIDVHVHVGNSASLYVAGSINAVTDRMAIHGITHSIISPIPGFEDPLGKESAMQMNIQVAEIKKENPDRFPMAMGVAEPRHGKAALEEVEHALGELKLDGLMFHNDFAGVEMHAPRMQEILAEAQRYKNLKMVMLHTAQHSMLEPPFAMWVLAEKFPEIKFVCGHPMMTLIHLDNMVAVAKKCPNVYLDTCVAWSHNDIIERAIDLLGGSERLIFGSDNPYYNKNLCIDKELIERAAISQDDRRKIYFENFERIFGEVMSYDA